MDKKSEIIYRTSDILSLYGLSNKGLFYYEQKGLIAPPRSRESNYRVYSLTETSKLHECRFLRECGFSVDESISLVAHASPDELIASYDKRLKEINDNIRWSEMVIEQLIADRKSIEQIKKHTIPREIIKRPPMIRISLRDIHMPYASQSEMLYQQWQDYLPVANASLLLTSCSSGNENPIVNLGFIMNANALEQLGTELPESAQFLPPVLCYHTFISGPSNELADQRRFKDAYAYLAHRGIHPTGAAVTRMISSMDIGSGMQRYDHLWIPIE